MTESMQIRSAANTFTAKFKDDTERNFLKGILLTEIQALVSLADKKDIVLAKVNNRIRSLHETVSEDCTVAWVSIHSIEGMRSYQQTLCMILIQAAHELYPKRKLFIDHSLGSGLFCEFKGRKRLTVQMIRKLKKRMQEIIDSDTPLTPVRLKREEILEQFQSNGEFSPYTAGDPALLTHLTFYQLKESTDYPGYPLLPSTGLIQSYDLQPWPPGMVLNHPETDIGAPSEPVRGINLFLVFHEYSLWERILGISKVADVNEAIGIGNIYELIKIAEGLHEKKIAETADLLARKNNSRRVVLIAGPSSSGKTTFTKRLEIQLKVNGLRPLVISLDDYFYDWVNTPKDANGDYDFETPKALDIERLNRDLTALLGGETVQIPKYDFKAGKSLPGPECRLQTGQPVLIEGIHCLNDDVTCLIPRKRKMKIYVSDLAQLNVTDHLRVSTSDVRLLRRLVRDSQFRGHTVESTLERWPMVRRGEENNIFPFQEDADIIFNSSLMYEIPVLKALAEPLLAEVSQENPVYPEVHRIQTLLTYFMTISPEKVPLNSILREFTGGSSFTY